MHDHQGTNQTPMLTYQQRRTLQLINLEAQLKLSTGPRGRIDLLSQVLTIQMDLRHIALTLTEAQGKEIRL
jgi:hypothetical protein